MMRPQDDEVATLTTQAPLRVAVVADQSGSARIVHWENKDDVPEGAMLGLLIPVDPKQRSLLSALIKGEDGGPESI